MDLCKKCSSVCECVKEHSPVLVCDYHLSAKLRKSAKDSTALAQSEKEGSLELSLALVAVGVLVMAIPCVVHHCCIKKKK